MFRYYVKLGVLSIRANPALSALMVAAIGIGIGACMTIVTVYYIMNGDPIPHKSSVLYHVQVDSWDPNEPFDEPNEPPRQMTYLDATGLYDAGKEFRQVVMFKSDRVVQPSGDDELPFELETRATTNEFFQMFDTPFQYGSGWEQSADLNEERVVVLAQILNEQLFGGEDSVGESVVLNGEAYRVVGVLDDWQPIPKFYDVNNNSFEPPAQIMLPFSVAVAGEHGSSGNTNCWKPLSEGGYQAFLASECIWIQMWAELPTAADKDRYVQFLNAYVAEQKTLGRFPRPLNNRVSNVNEWLENQEVVEEDVSVLLGLAMMFLTVCLLNTIGLLLAKVMRRSKDISLRRALGASKRMLFTQHVIEAGLIGVGGGLLGIGLTWLGLRGIQNLYADLEFVQSLVRMDWVMVAFAVGLAIASALAAALYPTWRACSITPASELRIQ